MLPQQAMQNSGLVVDPNTGIVMVRDVTGLTPSATNIYGRYSIFSPCEAGDVYGLQVQTHGIMNWLGWRPNSYYRRRVSFITWWGPEGMHNGTATTGATAPCSDPPGWEYGQAGYDLVHTSWYSRAGDPLDPHTVVQDRCETTPRYRLNGQIIRDDVEWQMNGMMSTLKQSVQKDIVTGSHDNAYEMNGFESIIKAGYLDDFSQPTPQVDSLVLDWAFDDLDGNVNGYGNFFDLLDERVNDVEYRASAVGNIAETDMVLFTSRFQAVKLLDAYAAYTTAGVTTSSDITDQALRAAQRASRISMNGGPLYDGQSVVGVISLKSGRRLPVMCDDSFAITRYGVTNRYANDIYLLVRTVGNVDVFYGEFLDMRQWAARIKTHDGAFRGRSDSAGRFALKGVEQNFCHKLIMGMSPELYLAAPWAQTRFVNVGVQRVLTPVNGDPFQPYYLPGGNTLYPASSYEAN